jgi:hypothetical protein
LPTTDGTVLTSASSVTASQLPAGSVLQVVSVTKTDTSTLTGSAAYADIPGISASITPSNSSNKVLIMVGITYGGSSNAYGVARLLRGATAISIGDSSGSRIVGTTTIASNDASRPRYTGVLFLDSPATTSSTTYKMQARSQSGQSIKINTSNEDEDNTTTGVRATSTITVMEIKG